ncbi:NADH-quinone oxidoreductase subunit J [Boudabousia marimammalium]|uniref:NADH-quinone oxidoreductase subunit J n=1 Tax=Boudabousia marimammalium TaxID=156892 RepID=A0A1Q5PMS0_9ACTO|nr:NADH-quinone oxidoreductase subunit J [Boudabousia marimammalium]OKL48740.1 hypothetical protein BM477_05975 [Boudabousia marimammalium]
MQYLVTEPVLGVDWSAPGEFIKFSLVAVFMIACAIGVARFSRAAYAAICMIGVMVGFAMLYLLNGAEFMGVVQIVVYTGAIMMLFLFVLMLIGIGATDNYKNGSRGGRVSAYLLSALIVLGLGGAVYVNVSFTQFGPVDESYRSMENLGATLFNQHLFTIEISAILLITAALGAIVLTHPDKLLPSRTQRDVAEAKMAAYAASQRHPGQLPAPGVYAESNAFDVPALSGETHQPIPESVPRVLRVRGINRTVGEVSPVVAQRLLASRVGNPAEGLHGPEASRSVGRSGAWGMPGPQAPQGLKQMVDEPAPAIESADSDSSPKEENK